MLLRFLSLVPFLRLLCDYRFSSHRAAFPKFAVLWLISISPLAIAAVTAPVPSPNSGWLAVFCGNFLRSFYGTHQFIYAVSFITPIFYLLWEKYQELAERASAGKSPPKKQKLLPNGYGWLLIWSVVVFLITALAYADSVNGNAQGRLTLLRELSRNEITTVAVYLYALLCWYFIILESLSPPRAEFTKALRSGEEKSVEIFSSRIASRKEAEQ